MSGFTTITQVIEDDDRILVRHPQRGWDDYLVIEPGSVGGSLLYIRKAKAAELRDLLDEALAEPAADENAAEASIAQTRAVGS